MNNINGLIIKITYPFHGDGIARKKEYVINLDKIVFNGETQSPNLLNYGYEYYFSDDEKSLINELFIAADKLNNVCMTKLFDGLVYQITIFDKENNPKEIKYVSMVNSSLNDFLAKLNALAEIVKALIKTEIE